MSNSLFFKVTVWIEDFIVCMNMAGLDSCKFRVNPIVVVELRFVSFTGRDGSCKLCSVHSSFFSATFTWFLIWFIIPSFHYALCMKFVLCFYYYFYIFSIHNIVSIVCCLCVFVCSCWPKFDVVIKDTRLPCKH